MWLIFSIHFFWRQPLILEWQQLTLVENSEKLLHFLHDSVAWINFWADLRSTLTATWQQKNQQTVRHFCGILSGKNTKEPTKKQGKTLPWCLSSHGCHGQPWPTMANLNGLVEVTSRQQIVPTTTPWPFNSMVLRTACSRKLSEEVKIRFLNIERIILYTIYIYIYK